jgi:hypothetical protein
MAARFIEKWSSALLRAMAVALAPVLARTPVVFGDVSKVKIAETAKVVNALLNVQSGNILIKDFVFLATMCVY